MLYVVGLGLGNERDITLRGLDAVKSCSRVYLEAYTSILLVDKAKLEELYGREVIVADREMVEQGIESVLQAAVAEDVAFLVVGDPFGATTHTDLVLRAKEIGAEVQVIHNASIMTAVGSTGLQLYRFGETVSIPFFTDTWRPDSFYPRIKRNSDAGLHTLCLLDIKVREPSLEALCRGKKIYEAPRYMTVNVALRQLLEVEDSRKEGAYNSNTMCVGIARLGAESQLMVSGTMEELLDVDFGGPLHSFILVGETHDLEDSMLRSFKVSTTTPRLPPNAESDDA